MDKTFIKVKNSGRIGITLHAIRLGNDILVGIYGGDRPHIGAVAVGVPGSTADSVQVRTAETSVIALTGHREDKVTRDAAQRIALETGAVVSVSCGIHLDTITAEEIACVCSLIEDLTGELINWVAAAPCPEP
jgi:gallate decarboxylase subunit D